MYRDEGIAHRTPENLAELFRGLFDAWRAGLLTRIHHNPPASFVATVKARQPS